MEEGGPQAGLELRLDNIKAFLNIIQLIKWANKQVGLWSASLSQVEVLACRFDRVAPSGTVRLTLFVIFVTVQLESDEWVTIIGHVGVVRVDAAGLSIIATDDSKCLQGKVDIKRQ
eukprot:7804666-Pyramimonas_sp.AAC.1